MDSVKKTAATSKPSKVSSARAEPQVTVPISSDLSTAKGGCAKIPGLVNLSSASDMRKSPSSSGALRVSEKGVSDSEEDLEKQAAEISLRLSLLKAKRERVAEEEKSAEKEKINLSDLNKATDEYLSKSASAKPTRDSAMSSRTLSKKELDNRLNRIHEAIKIKKGSDWEQKRKMALEAGKRMTLRTKEVSNEKGNHSPILSAEPLAAEKSKDIDVDESNVAAAPVEKEATPLQEESSPLPKETPVSVVSPPIHEETSPTSLSRKNTVVT